MFAVCLIFWFELHARWLEWCQIGSLSQSVGTLLGEIPAVETVVFGVRGLALWSAEVSDLTDGKIKNARDIGILLNLLRMCILGCLPYMCYSRLNF